MGQMETLLGKGLMSFSRDWRMTEKDLLRSVRDMARLLGWQTYHTHTSRFSEPGFPDLVLLRGSRLIFAELKVGKGKLRQGAVNRHGRVWPGQAWWLENLAQAAGVATYLWRDTDWASGEIEVALR